MFTALIGQRPNKAVASAVIVSSPAIASATVGPQARSCDCNENAASANVTDLTVYSAAGAEGTHVDHR